MDYQTMSDSALLRELGARVRRERLNANITQGDIAIKAGVSRRSVQNLEAGKACTMSSLVRILRALDKLYALDSFLPEPGLSPVALAKLHGRQRQRAAYSRIGRHGEAR